MARKVDYQVVVIGGGHAGVEAALAVSRLGGTVALMTADRSKLALMSCNPAIGGVGKSHIVKEIDALGGIMALAADQAGIQFRRLNLSRGPAVWSTRIQCDRREYNRFVCQTVNSDSRIEVIEALVGKIVIENGSVCGIVTEDGREISCQAAIICSGTFLGGLIHIGEDRRPAGRINESAAYLLSDSLRSLGFETGRLKTGTPPRLEGASIDFSVCEAQPGDNPIPFFSHRSNQENVEQEPCFITYTTEATRAVINENLDKSPMFTGEISSTGPRYCPSIEDKFYRFPQRQSHQIFLEPEGAGTSEIYPNGFSTSLPEEIQRQAIRTVRGLEKAEITQPGYAVEYDYCPAYQIQPTLETRRVQNLYFAGQINGTSGYEEAAGQGLLAGVNSWLKLTGEKPMILDRSEAYLGVMVDDLVTRSTTEPYRMFTSRAEHRLALREDNARDRMAVYAERYNLVSKETLAEFSKLQSQTEDEILRLEKHRLNVAVLGEISARIGRKNNVSLADLLRMPHTSYTDIAQYDREGAANPEALGRAEIIIRYAGYIEKQNREIERFRRMETEVIPSRFEYHDLKGLKTEAREKLSHFRPVSLGQAGRIEGVTSGDVAVLAVALRRFRAAS